MKSLIEGIRIVGDNVVFNFNQDSEGDIIPLKFQKFNRKLSTRSGTEIYFGYQYNSNVNSDELVKVREAIKMMTANISDIRLMVMKAINGYLKITNTIPDIIITPKSSGPLVNFIAKLFKEKLGDNVLIATDIIVKNTVENIQIDPVKLKNMDPNQINNIKNIIKSAFKTGSFKMKSVPIPMRRVIIDFMKFDDAVTKTIFNKINTGNVLLLDDIYTGGSTFNEMMRILKTQNPQNMNGFILLLSK